jgi:uncharacterized protein (DUF1778 family)
MRPTVDKTTQINVRLDEQDKALIEAVAAHERTSISEILRRAVRLFAKSIGVEQPEVKSTGRARRPK